MSTPSSGVSRMENASIVAAVTIVPEDAGKTNHVEAENATIDTVSADAATANP